MTSAPAPTTILLETPDAATSPAVPSTTPAPAPPETPSSPAPDGLPALPPASDPATAPAAAPAPAPATGDLVPAAMTEPAAPEAKPAAPVGGDTSPATAPAAPAASSSPAAAEIDMPPLPSLGADATRLVETGGPPHRESEVPAATPTPATAPAVASPDPAAAPAAAPGTDELPPLPGDLGRDAGAAGPSAAPGAIAPAVEQPAPAATRPEPVPVADPVARSAPAPAPGESAPPDGSTPLAAADEPLPPLPTDSAAVPQSGATLAPPPDAGTAPSVNPSPAAPVAAAAPPAGDVSLGAPTAVAPAGPTVPAEERAVPVPQPDAAAGAAATAAGTAPTAAPEPSPATGPAQGGATGSAEARFFLSTANPPPARYTPEQARRVAELTARQEKEDEFRSQIRTEPRPEGPTTREAGTSNLQTQTQYDIIRSPSPAEARPIKAIPVPEDWVPLAARNWTPQRKYWAPAATCHLPLYFQDPVLERYGHPVEQFVGPLGRYLSYPVDDPKQSTQRNQILQPFFSWGLFALQIAAWPYNGIMDPPWEAQYDLGYYRPGDMVPTDTYWLPLHGYGPPLRGNSY